ncbi:hypothetical protein [Planomicrobium sp. Y74]|uniref:hypothetical protein n=1 Tax=Planomicrobium sp. Y74 TaxID=2478977 RepID=UPI000EF4C364|nr:hypothetical protein D9754_10795 [Planomicrobium sp. Y74]
MKKNTHVVGAVITLNGKILCAQRGHEKALSGLWEFSGGKVDPLISRNKHCKRKFMKKCI